MTAPAREYDPAALIRNVGGFLGSQGIDVDLDAISATPAFLAASALLLTMGVQPILDPEDTSSAAEMVRIALVEARSKDSTARSRVG